MPAGSHILQALTHRSGAPTVGDMKRVTLSARIISITLPTAMPAHADIEARALETFSRLCGGATVTAGEGAYIMQATGETVREPHTRVWAYTSEDMSADSICDAVWGVAKYALLHSDEECILAEDLNGPALYFRD